MFDILDNCDKVIPMRFQSLNGSLVVVIYLSFGTWELGFFKRVFRRPRKQVKKNVVTTLSGHGNETFFLAG